MQCSNIHGLEKIDNLLNMKILKEKNDEQFTEHQKNGQNKTVDDTVSPTDMSHGKITDDSPRLPSPKEILPAATTLTITPITKENYDQLFAQCQHFAKVFKDDSTEKGQRLHAAFIAWQDFILTADKLTTTIEKFAHKYDLDENTPGNGYRSFINVTDSCIAYGQEICKRLHIAHHTLFFRKKLFMKEVEACSQLLSSLCSCLHYLLILNEWSRDSGDLFSEGKHTAEELFELGDTINQYCFYGRCLGFQYGDSIRGVLRFISISMASFSETFYSHESDGPVLKTTRSVWTSGKYLLNPELRARRIVNISQNANIEFCKSFWFLAESELMHKIPSIVGSSIKVNRVIEIPSAPLQLPRVRKTSKCAGTSATDVNQNDHDELVNIPVPSSHLGPGIPITVRLLSYKRREGMVGEGSRYSGWRKLPPPSRSILFHCHGGGFVAQSSKSHELYLRDWAVALDVPILSVDYSLAPEAPFPRALEEVFYAYCWMLKNCEHLGTTAEHIVVAGDSAGANLSIGVALKCIEMGIRIPDGIFLAYCPTLIGFVPSPARLLCLMDPLLPFGFMMRCLRAYAAPGSETLEENAKHVEEAANVRNASRNPQFTLHIENEAGGFSANSSRRTSAAKSPLSSVAENSKWDQMQHCQNSKGAMIADEDVSEESSNTYASASYHSQTVERTDLPSTEDDNSSCVSFEDDSQPIVHFPIEMTTNITKHTESEEYIDRFLNKYVVDNAEECEKLEINECAAISKDLNPTFPKTISEENLFIETGKELITFDSLHDRFNHAFNSITNTFNRYTESYEIRSTENDRTHHHYIKDLRNMDALIARSPTSEFGFLIPRDPFLSPYFASDEWLKQLPQTKILSLDMDPCLDDCVMFAKKLKLLGTPITLDILKGLPHGFLNFTMLSNEAMEGSKRCIKLLQELLYVPPKAET